MVVMAEPVPAELTALTSGVPVDSFCSGVGPDHPNR